MVVEVVEVVVESGGGGGGVVESGGGGGGGAVVEPYCEEVHRGSTTSERHHRRWGGYLRGGPPGFHNLRVPPPRVEEATARKSTGVPQPPSATTEGGRGYCEEVHRGSTDSTEGFTTGSPHREGGECVCG